VAGTALNHIDMDGLTEWIDRLSALKVYVAKGDRAPHKPLLLLVVLDLAEQGRIAGRRIELTAELAYRFSVYASIVAHRRTQRIQVRFPFFHLHSDGFWCPLDEHLQPARDPKYVKYVDVDPGFLALARIADFRIRSRQILIAKYFQPEERAALYALCGLPVPSKDELRRDAEREPIKNATALGRDAKFRISVIYNYQFTCALTRYRLTTIDGGSIVDAAHIHQFSSSRNNDPKNGLALSKNAHWLFDNGLWALRDDFRVIVAREAINEHAGDAGSKGLADYAGTTIHLPDDRSVWPDPRYLEWHRRHRFKGKDEVA
jgi:putative restriction endonuclease